MDSLIKHLERGAHKYATETAIQLIERVIRDMNLRVRDKKMKSQYEKKAYRSAIRYLETRVKEFRSYS